MDKGSAKKETLGVGKKKEVLQAVLRSDKSKNEDRKGEKKVMKQ